MTNPGGRFLGVLLAVAMVTPLLIVAAASVAQAQIGDSIVVVDSVGDVGRRPSLVLNSAGNPVVSYYDVTNQDLKVLTCGNPDCSSGNVVSSISAVDDRGDYSSLVLNSDGFPVVSYYNRTVAALGLLGCYNATCSAYGDTTFNYPTIDEGSHSSLALNSSYHPVVTYYDATNDDLQILVCDDVNCNNRTQVILDSVGDVGRYSSMVLDAAGNPIISYYNQTDFDLYVVRCSDPVCSARSITNPDVGGTVGIETSIALDSSGNPVMSYFDATNASLKVLHCSNASCTSTNSTTSLDTGGFVGLGSSLMIDASGDPVVSYWDAANGDLKVLHCGDANCTSGNSINSPDTADGVGEHTSLALDATGNPVIAYYDTTNGDLKVMHCNDPDCAPPLCQGLVPTIDMNANGGDGIGTTGDDIIAGTGGADIIRGLEGNDLLCGLGGDDVISGGPGNDKIDGQVGDDTLSGGGGSDFIWGRGGNDTLRGQGGPDILMGGSGDDIIDGNGALDSMHGEAGSDTINGQNGGDYLIGGSGDDHMAGQTGPDTFEGGPDDDTMFGGDGADTLYGNAGFDKCSGNTGPDSAEAASCEQTPGVETLF